jgi:hypothetical protein
MCLRFVCRNKSYKREILMTIEWTRSEAIAKICIELHLPIDAFRCTF